MGGSRKGERRGGAKPRLVRKPPKSKAVKAMLAGPRKGGRPPGAKNKPKRDQLLVEILNKRVPPDKKEAEVEMYFTVIGRRARMPKEIMLDAARYFEESAIEYAEVLRANLKLQAAAKTDEELRIIGQAVALAETQVDRYVSMAADCAMKVAPFLHPRLAAVVTRQDDGSSPTSLLQLLMQDLDEAGKPARYIEHDAGEVIK
jgi:hypothetical protein